MGWGDFLDAASGLLGAYSSYKEGSDKRDAAKAQAKEEEKKAVDALRRGVEEADRQAKRKRALISKQRATMGASGVVVDSGTFSDVLADTAASGKEDEDTIMQNALREAWGYQQAAKQATMAASSAYSSGLIEGVGTLAAGTYKYGANAKRNWW